MTAMVIERLRDDDWQSLRDVRLTALADAPHAFCARLADERVYGREKWISFLGAAAWFVARRDEAAVALAAGMTGVRDPEPELISMWVAPAERGRGIGSALTRAVLDWARAEAADTLALWVTDGNVAARRMYERFGFAATGEWAPTPHTAATGEIRMRASLDDGIPSGNARP